jgi:hypothetical protein
MKKDSSPAIGGIEPYLRTELLLSYSRGADCLLQLFFYGLNKAASKFYGKPGRYIIRASFWQERIPCLPEESRIIYRSKDNRKKIFDTLDWLAAMTSSIPNQGEQMVRYYGNIVTFSGSFVKKKIQDALSPPAFRLFSS